MLRPLYPSKSYSQSEQESLVQLIVVFAIIVALGHWLFNNHPVWFWGVTALACVLLPVEIRRFCKEMRQHQEWWQQLTRDWR